MASAASGIVAMRPRSRPGAALRQRACGDSTAAGAVRKARELVYNHRFAGRTAPDHQENW